MKGHGLSPQCEPAITSNLRAIRDSIGISRFNLSMKTESTISIKTIVQAELGANSRIKTAIELCNALGVTLNDVYGEHLTSHKEYR